MKANNGSGNHTGRDTWRTPGWIFDVLNKQFNFIFDCCALPENKKTILFSSDFEQEVSVQKMAWMNPPFSIAWRMFEHFFKVVKKGVCIYRCDNLETGIWQKVIFPNATWIFIPDRRVSYEGMDGSGARFPSALIGYNVDPPKDLEGTLLRVSKIYIGKVNE